VIVLTPDRPWAFHPELNFRSFRFCLGELTNKVVQWFSAYERIIADVAIFSVRRRRQCADTGRRNADTAITITGNGVGSGLGFACDVPLGRVVIASHGRRCEHGSSDRSCRQQFEYGHGISPLYVAAQRRLASPAGKRTKGDRRSSMTSSPDATLSIKNGFIILNWNLTCDKSLAHLASAS
jgi:hypothetical protein